MNVVYIGSGEHASNTNRSNTHLYELFYKMKKGEPLTRKLLKAINEFVLDISIFYDLTKISLNGFLNAIKQNPNILYHNKR